MAAAKGWPGPRHDRLTGDRPTGVACHTRAVDLDLPAEHALLRRTVRDYMEGEVAPLVDEHERERTLPPRRGRQARRDGLARHPRPGAVGRRRDGRPGLRDRHRGDRPGLGLARADRRGAHVAGLRPDPPRRHRRPEARVPRPAGERQGHRRVRAHGAGRRERRRRAADDREAHGRRGRLGHRRRQAVHHQRGPGRHLRGRRADRHDRARQRRDQRVHRPGRHARVHRRAAGGEARAPRVGDRRAPLLRRPDPAPATCSARRARASRPS